MYSQLYPKHLQLSDLTYYLTDTEIYGNITPSFFAR